MAETEGGLPALMAERQRKLERLRADGCSPYPNHHRPDTTVAAFVLHYRGEPLAKAAPAAPSGEVTGSAAHAEREHRLAGRVMAINNFGKAAFVRIQDDTSDQLLVSGFAPPAHGAPQQGEPQRGLLQLYMRQENLNEASKTARAELDIGDWIYVVGSAMRTKTGELTLLVSELHVVTKALRPLPEKWHGLSDVEIRYRQRYLDLIVNPEVRAMFRLRARVQAWLRSYLAGQDFLEVETPMMQAQPGGANAKPFVTTHHALGCELYLRIAPELYLKRLVVGGLTRVFEINRNFRNEGISTAHNPEFTMLELYQAFADVDDMAAHVERIIGGLARDVLGTSSVTVGEHTVHLTAPFARLSMRAAIAANGGPAEDRLNDAAEVAAALSALHLPPAPTWGHGLSVLFEHYAEKKLIQPTIIYDFPSDVSPLARQRDGDARIAERFELYVAGREVANAFSELNDPALQRARFVAQAALKAAGDQEAQMVDEDYLVALEHGLPPTGGLGIGIDRLMMLLTGAQSIRDVVLFPQMRPER